MSFTDITDFTDLPTGAKIPKPQPVESAVTRNERTDIYKRGYMDGYKAALDRLKWAIDESEELLPIIPEELFKDGAKAATQPEHSVQKSQ